MLYKYKGTFSLIVKFSRTFVSSCTRSEDRTRLWAVNTVSEMRPVRFLLTPSSEMVCSAQPRAEREPGSGES